MEECLRIEKLGEVSNREPYMTGIRINYQGEVHVMDAYKIPLNYLIYNKYNGRIGSRVKSFEKERFELRPEVDEHKEIIEKFLWESKEDRNESTEKSLVRDGQQKYGIVTSNGIIIDGNRRASILNRIYSKRNTDYKNLNVSHAEYFIAIILPENAKKRDIISLETRYQMGVDEKVDYNAIEKYLKCSDLLENGFNIDDIAEMMGEKPVTINKYIQALDLMNQYLDFYGYSGIYTRLDRREGQFLDLLSYLDAYKKHKSFVDWNYDDQDISDLQLICFDYIRASYEGKDFRNIASTSKKEARSIFSIEKLWSKFKEEHFKNIDMIKEDDIETIRKENPNESMTDLLERRDLDWALNIKGKLKGNLNKSVRILEDYQESNRPEALLEKALKTIQMVDIDIDNFFSQNVEELVNEINRLTFEFKKIIKKGK